MKALAPIAVVVALLAAVPLITASNVVLNFLVVALLTALVGQGWNLLGGYGGQYSFGHAAFFGTGAYVTAILQMRYGVNAWLGLVIGITAGALVVKALGELTKMVAGDAPGLDLVIYGLVLVAVIGFAPRGIAGLISGVVSSRGRRDG